MTRAPTPVSDIAARVVRWQRIHGRHGLPWQGTRDPYRVWLSEVMLQQTQVGTVLGYYPRFLARFPNVHALAAAPLDDVLALWSGLGYYSRARLLHRCAQSVVAEHGGQFPPRSEDLQRLPGIGASTAAAIAAFCFGERAAILDGNVKRVLSRVLGFAQDLARPAHERELRVQAQSLLPVDTADMGPYTQGLMDLGAQVCTARRAHCDRCPLTPVCAAAKEDRPERYPVRAARAARSRRESALLWLTRGHRVWLSQRPARGVWASLWCLPELPDAAAVDALTRAWPGRGEALAPLSHALTHVDWTLWPCRWRLPARLAPAALARVEASLPVGRWFEPEQALGAGLAAPVRRLLSGD